MRTKKITLQKMQQQDFKNHEITTDYFNLKTTKDPKQEAELIKKYSHL